MNSKERFLFAMTNKVPDRVPATPDISCYIPCKRTGLPFWDVFFFNAVPLWQAYIDAADYYGIDAWTGGGGHMGLLYTYDNIRYNEKVICDYDKNRDAMLRKTIIYTPDGNLDAQEVCFRFDPPSPTVKPIKDIVADWPKYKWLLNIPTGYDKANCEMLREQCRKRGYAFGLQTGYPGFHIWSCFMQGGIEAVTFAQYDHPEILQEWFEFELAIGTRMMELIISAKPDYVFFGGSGTMTCASPDLVMKYVIPALKKFTAMAKNAGIPSLLHSCGKQRLLIDMLVEHTDLNCVNPLERKPMGDIDLAEVKQAHGHKIALMGNLHTTEIMLNGTAQDVINASLQAMRDAGQNGGFILSSGDQCGRETPDENLFAMVETAQKYGIYDRLTGELKAL